MVAPQENDPIQTVYTTPDTGEFPGSEDEFFDYLERHGFDSKWEAFFPTPSKPIKKVTSLRLPRCL
ncbi:hypothetical protein SPFM15_00189 [Salmonella phage SPFM15]|nr:hypothetical protein SPFM5_00184 [Salmonella phage SPFM5]VFR13813.1 hypothetical protein SPFM15_00189 [Salmonella phage SPFM15]